MPLKKSVGHMYPWVTHTHAHLGGECPHRCSYCYVDNPRFGRAERYTGPVRLIERELAVQYGSGRTIFVENCGDLFAGGVDPGFVGAILAHCRSFPDNTYVLQTKDPARALGFCALFPPRTLFGTTIESDRRHPGAMGHAPPPEARMRAMVEFRERFPGVRRFVTVEPALAFDPAVLLGWLRSIGPEFVNIGADSKGRGLDEPGAGEILALLDGLRGAGIPVREKHNLGRLLGADSPRPAG